MRKPLDQIYAEALAVLREGGLILYPTDTVWGIGCDATNPDAVAKVFALKRRDDAKALVLLADNLDRIARYVREIPDVAVQLVEVNDRPMTLIYPGAITGEKGKPGDRHFLAWNAVAEDGSVGIRIPQMEFCRQLVYKLGRPIVSTSANPSGEPTPRRFADIDPVISAGVDYVVEPSLEKGATCAASQILKVGLRGEIEIIRG